VSAGRTEKAVIDGTTACDGCHKRKSLQKRVLESSTNQTALIDIDVFAAAHSFS